MTFYDLLEQVLALLQRHHRLSYRALKLQFPLLDPACIDALRDELLFQGVARDAEGRGLIWLGGTSVVPQATGSATLPSPATGDNGLTVPASGLSVPEAERRQLTVMFCDLVGSTQLSGQLDPEDLRAVVRAYQEAAADVIQHYAGHIAQYLGDGLLVYFGYPTAHEDDARRAVHTGLGIVEAIATLSARLTSQYGVQLAVRLGIHTGPVVVGVMGGGGRHEHLALGETPNIAARLQALAPTNAVVISAVTARLVHRSFALEDLGTHTLHGVAEPMTLSRVRGLLAAPSRDEAFVTAGVPLLVGRGEESGLLRRRWEQSKAGLGQVVFISGEAGIGKSALVEGLRAQVRAEGLLRIAYRCSPYHTTSALYPVITHLEHLLQLAPDDPPATKLVKLEAGLRPYDLPLAEVVPLLAGLLSVPLPAERYAPLTVTPQHQKQQTLDALVAWMVAEAERQPVLVAWEDLHWADPTTLEVLGLVIEQAPTVPMLHVLTYRPEFSPPWPPRSHITPLVLNRLERLQVEALITQRAGGKTLPAEVVHHIVAKTDGVPLYVEELTKMLLASPLLREEVDQYVLTGPLRTVAIPETLQDALMARLDQLNTAKEVAQLGAVLGREFPYDLLQAIAPQDEDTLQTGLAQLVDAELLYQRGRPPRARYMFKHALIQDAAYASLLRKTRQHYHQQIAQVLAGQFPEAAETQPELVAHHYTQAGVMAEAITYWLRAGQRSTKRCAFVEARSHLQQGLALLPMLLDVTRRVQYELDFQVTLGTVVMALQGQASPEVENIYNRAWDLCQQLDGTPQLGRVLWGLWRFYNSQGMPQKSRQIGEQLRALAEQQQDPTLLLMASQTLATSLVFLGDIVTAQMYCEQGIQLYTPMSGQELTTFLPYDPGISCFGFSTQILWLLGYPEQALARSAATITRARELAHPATLVAMLSVTAAVHLWCRQASALDDHGQELAMLCDAQRFPLYAAHGMIFQGWVQCLQGHAEAGVAQMRQGLDVQQTTSSRLVRPLFLALLAEGCAMTGAIDEGLQALEDALHEVGLREERLHEAELYRLRGVLLLRQPGTPQAEAETWLQRALDVARRQEAKALELRAAMSLARLWQQQGRRTAARDLLAPLYSWFTEGFDTADLQEAKALLGELGG